MNFIQQAIENSDVSLPSKVENLGWRPLNQLPPPLVCSEAMEAEKGPFSLVTAKECRLPFTPGYWETVSRDMHTQQQTEEHAIVL